MTPPRAVTFDFWNTLMWEEPDGLRDGRLAAWAGILEEVGVTPEYAALERAHGAAHTNYVAAWQANRQYVVEHAVDEMVHELALDLPSNVRNLLIDAFSDAGRRTVLHVCEGVERCLFGLKDAGVRLGIICDIGLTPSPVLRGHLAARGILDLFDDTTFSDEVGWYKPDSRIFAHALRSLGVSRPETAVHVGDRLRTDVAGARKVGMGTIRYRAIFDDVDDSLREADLVADDYDAVLTALVG